MSLLRMVARGGHRFSARAPLQTTQAAIDCRTDCTTTPPTSIAPFVLTSLGGAPRTLRRHKVLRISRRRESRSFIDALATKSRVKVLASGI